jgi:transposase
VPRVSDQETLYHQWRERLLDGGKQALAKLDRLKRRVGQLERALGRKTYELEVAGELSRGWE